MHRRDEQASTRWQGHWPLIAVLLLGVAAVVIGIFVTSGAGQVEDQLGATAEQAQSLGEQVTRACAQGVVVQDPQGQDLCQRAAEVQSDPVPGTPVPGLPGVQGLPGERGPGPTPEQIEAAVASYCAVRAQCAGRAPTPSEVAAAVAQYLTANPPQPGRPPTAAEIADAVATYFATNPPPAGETGAAGRDGRDGAAGRPPTAAEIQAAVDSYLAANPPPEGPPGPAGPNCQEDTHLETVQFADERFGLACVFDDQPDPGPDPTTTAVPTTDPMSGDEGLPGG